MPDELFYIDQIDDRPVILRHKDPGFCISVVNITLEPFLKPDFGLTLYGTCAEYHLAFWIQSSQMTRLPTITKALRWYAAKFEGHRMELSLIDPRPQGPRRVD